MSSNRSTTYLIVGIILIGLNAFAFAPYVSDATLDTVRDTVQSSYDDEEDYSGDSCQSSSPEILIQKKLHIYRILLAALTLMMLLEL